MASGEPIDEQRSRRTGEQGSSRTTNANNEGTSRTQQGARVDDDDDVDPNDVPNQQQNTTNVAARSGKWKSTMYESGSEDEDDYD